MSAAPIIPIRDRLWEPFRKLVALLVAPTRFYGRYRYTISNPTSSTVDVTPVDSTLGLPSFKSISLDSDSISVYTPPSGGKCHVQFEDGNPALPVVVWTAGAPTMASLLGGPNPVARQGDQVMVFLPPTLVMTILSGTFAGSTGTIVVPNPITGAITQGSAQVSSA